MKKKAVCTECFYEFDVDENVIMGEVITCEDCGIELEVIEIEKNKVKLQPAESEEEDWGE